MERTAATHRGWWRSGDGRDVGPLGQGQLVVEDLEVDIEDSTVKPLDQLRRAILGLLDGRHHRTGDRGGSSVGGGSSATGSWCTTKSTTASCSLGVGAQIGLPSESSNSNGCRKASASAAGSGLRPEIEAVGWHERATNRPSWNVRGPYLRLPISRFGLLVHGYSSTSSAVPMSERFSFPASKDDRTVIS